MPDYNDAENVLVTMPDGSQRSMLAHMIDGVVKPDYDARYMFEFYSDGQRDVWLVWEKSHNA